MPSAFYASSPVLSQLVVEVPNEEELFVAGRNVLALLERGAHLLLHRVELLVGLRQVAHDRPPHRFVVRLLHEVQVALQFLRDDAREVENPVGRRLHLSRAARSSSESGWRKSCSMTAVEIAATSAPISAASSTWIGLRSSATTICVWKP